MYFIINIIYLKLLDKIKNMKFCSICNNMYYIQIDKSNNNTLTYYCRNCGNVDSNLENNVCIINTKTNNSISFDNIVNEYTKLDPSLPRVNNILCPNNDCTTNINPETEKEIIYLRYDHDNMKYLYICSHCDLVWKAN